MTGKELKTFAMTLHDEALICIRERPYGAWTKEFQIQATTEKIYPEPQQETNA